MDDERIISMLEDVPDNSTEESNSELENDHCSDHIISSGTEQGASSVESSSGHENEDESDDDVPLSFLRTIRSIFDSFVLNCQKAYIPHEYMTIDEMLWAFRGRCGVRVYIPSKPAKYGIKAYALVDAKSFYTFNIEVYPGKQPDGPYAFSNTAYDVVDRLVKSITKSHRNLTFDNWFTSYELMKHLLAEHGLTATGTVRKNKRCIPNSFLKTGKQPASSMFGFQRDVSIVSYAPKKNKVVILMSTLHHDDLIDVTTGDKRKPEMVTFYNSTKAGVDVVDEMSVNYDVSRNSKRWPMTVFYAILNIAAINANIIYRANRNLNTKRTEFIRNLGLSLVYEHLRQRKDKTNIPLYIRNRISSQIGEASASLSSQNIGARPVRCRDCPNKKDRKTKNACKHCGKAICKEHAVLFCSDCANVQD
ncbi:unnamed protein product [Arctia plantaginis]|uniref:PiggyBac transposable element-derived protein domain-containing protein n=1 Tax=Arctia plantaginis TaxID=874455 RepID=A0A8S1BL15_ARCPL|nr:unnamed protein product [Arctia plantaginis]